MEEKQDSGLLNNISEREARVADSLNHKSFLIILKYIPHFTALGYIVSTLLQFLGIEVTTVGYFIHLSIISWLFIYLTSILFRYCYVHRLPLYYIGLNELLVVYDYHIGLPVSDNKLLVVHLLLIAFLIFGYSLYYINNKRNVKINLKSITTDN